MSYERCRKAGILPGASGLMEEGSEALLSIGSRCLNAESLPILLLLGHLAGDPGQKQRSHDLRLVRAAYAEPKTRP